MAKKIFLNVVWVTLAATLAAGAMILLVLYQAFEDRVAKELVNAAQLTAQTLGIDDDGTVHPQDLRLENMRITWIDADGTVLFDNAAITEQMDNHADRPEFQQARSLGVGTSVRYSLTLSEKTRYYAVLRADGTVIRAASTQQSVWGLLVGLLPAFFVVVVAVMILSSVLADRLAKRTLSPLNMLDLENPLENDVYEELSPLLNRIARQNKRINAQMSELAARQEQLTAISDNMREGLVMLSPHQYILAINQSAQQLFGVSEDACVGKHVLTLSRNAVLESLMQRASQGQGAEALMDMGARVYQLVVSPVNIARGRQAGTVLLLLDITERADAERMRREFSANVSHELKTPLTSISGYAEIMKNGVAKAEDMALFAGRIYDESNRLIALVEDIIRLSKLDEGHLSATTEDVDLLALCEDVAQRLAPLAARRDVAIDVQGERKSIVGVRIVLDEMLFNLFENAVKYNKRGGRVDIDISSENDEIVLTIKDTGIGIAARYHQKVFERFYRVDKSHSRETGGTGLGLSIVKHGARFHRARIFLDSAEGKGTTIKLVFPS
jgi:two-component system phosphate regulon sensor histidine kinase PhoR